MQNQNIKACRMKFRGQALTSTGMSGSFNPPQGQPEPQRNLAGGVPLQAPNKRVTLCAYVIYLVTSTPNAAYVGTGLGWQNANP